MRVTQERIEAGESNWVLSGQGSRYVRVIDQPLQIEAAHQIHQRATDSAETDHGNFASDHRFGRTMQVQVVVNAIGALAHLASIEIYISRAIRSEEHTSEL